MLRLVVLSVYPMDLPGFKKHLRWVFSLDFRTINSIESPTVREVDFKKSLRLRRIKLPEYVDSDDEDIDLPGAVPHNRRGRQPTKRTCLKVFKKE